jgi:YidC/Oxa1 family membrane protein insertase
MMFDQRNLIIAIVLSIAIVLGFEFLYNAPRLERERALQAERAKSQATTQVTPPGQPGTPAATNASAPSAPGAAQAVAASALADRANVIARGPRIRIESPDLQGSILLTGGRIDDLTLTHYRETTNPTSPAIVLLSPNGTANPYFAEHGWVAITPGIAVPGADTLWQADRRILRPGEPVTLSWDNGEGLRFERRYAIEGEFMFQVTQRVTNASGAPVQLHAYGLASRTGTPATLGFYILHEGPVGVFNGTLKETSYEDVVKARTIEQKTTGGWIGITDKYWLVALIPDQKRETTTRFAHSLVGGQDRYQVDILGPAETVAPGAGMELTTRLFGGAKQVRLLDGYADTLGITLFDRAIDFGWFWFLTKPIFKLLDFFNQLIGNFGLAILLLTVLIKLVFFPLANKSYRAMNKMKQLQPEMEKLRERYGEDRQRMSQEMMALYKKTGANPMSGCLPVVIQIPVFFALYKVLFITIEMRHAPFFGWIRDLSAPDPTTVFNLFGLIPWTPPDLLHVGAWPLVMGLTMFLQQKMSPQPPDPVQAKMFLALPVVFTIMLAAFPAGLVIYWAWNNVLSVLQQWVLMRRMGIKVGGGTAPAKSR